MLASSQAILFSITPTPRAQRRCRLSASPILLPDHPRWGEFLAALSLAPRCLRTTEHARAALESIPDIDAAATLEALRAMGGRCDCAILYGLGEDSHAWAAGAARAV